MALRNFEGNYFKVVGVKMNLENLGPVGEDPTGAKRVIAEIKGWKTEAERRSQTPDQFHKCTRDAVILDLQHISAPAMGGCAKDAILTAIYRGVKMQPVWNEMMDC